MKLTDVNVPIEALVDDDRHTRVRSMFLLFYGLETDVRALQQFASALSTKYKGTDVALELQPLKLLADALEATMRAYAQASTDVFMKTDGAANPTEAEKEDRPAGAVIH